MRDIGRNITTLRKKRGMTQDALAEALHVTRQTVSNYETGRSRPDIDMLEAIAQVLEADVNTVLYGLPVPKDKKRDYIRLAVSVGIFAVLLVVFEILYPICQELKNEQFNLLPQISLLLFLRPAWVLVLGWVAMQAVAVAVNATPLSFPWVKYVRWGVFALLAAMALVLLPFLYWLLEGMIVSVQQNTVSRSYQHFGVDYFAMQMLMKQPWVMGIFGVALWLIGFPKKK